MNEQLPTKTDFLEHHGCLDAQHAWTEFGGLSIAAAYAKFCDNPLRYQEDFMFMGGRAFAYYFPVVERFLSRQLALEENGDYDEFSILACGIAMQVEQHRRSLGDRVLQRIAALTNSVLEKLPKLDWEEIECTNRRNAVIRDWERVVAALKA